MKTYFAITALLVGLFLLTSCGDSDTSDAPDGPPSAAQRWKGMTEDERRAVCDEAHGTPDPVNTDPGSGQIPATGPDYKGMLNALIGAGFEQPDAAAMLPYAVNACG